MSFHWTERDWEHVKEVVRDESGIQRIFIASRFLKLFDCPLIREKEYLLQYLISMWNIDL
jgi:hypothetical protein